jgi:hypothetical protein
MTYIIAEPCIDIKDLSCVDVCPVDCIHEFGRILFIDPEECIDLAAPATPSARWTRSSPRTPSPTSGRTLSSSTTPSPTRTRSTRSSTSTPPEHSVQNPPLEAR